MVDLCYNYTIEESFSNVARHFEDREGFRRDLLNRFHQYWEEYCCKIHVFHKGDLEQIADIQVKEPFWDTAVRLVDQNSPMYSGVYETGYNKRKRERLLQTIYQFFCFLLSSTLFYAYRRNELDGDRKRKQD